MARWNIAPYKEQLDVAIKSGDWDTVEKVRSTAKQRSIEMMAEGDASGIDRARELFTHGYRLVQLVSRVVIQDGPEASAIRLGADAETMHMSRRLTALASGRDVRERVLSLIEASPNRAPIGNAELVAATGHRPESITRAVSQLRDEGRIVTRKVGRRTFHVLVAPPSLPTFELLNEQSNRTGKGVPIVGTPDPAPLDVAGQATRGRIVLNSTKSLENDDAVTRRTDVASAPIANKPAFL